MFSSFSHRTVGTWPFSLSPAPSPILVAVTSFSPGPCLHPCLLLLSTLCLLLILNLHDKQYGPWPLSLAPFSASAHCPEASHSYSGLAWPSPRCPAPPSPAQTSNAIHPKGTHMDLPATTHPATQVRPLENINSSISSAPPISLLTTSCLTFCSIS